MGISSVHASAQMLARVKDQRSDNAMASCIWSVLESARKLVLKLDRMKVRGLVCVLLKVLL